MNILPAKKEYNSFVYRSLSNKIVKKEFKVDLQVKINPLNKQNETYFVLANEKIKKVENNKPEEFYSEFIFDQNVHCVSFNANTQSMEITYLKHKVKRNNFKEEEDSIINFNREGESYHLYEEISTIRRDFYNQSQIKSLLNDSKYQNLLSSLVNVEISKEKNSISNTGLPETHLEEILEKNSFLKGIKYEYISFCGNNRNDIFTYYPDSLFLFIFDKISKCFNNPNKYNEIIFAGEQGCGKTSAILFFTYLIRLNPYNIIIPIFDYSLFIQNPKNYLMNELIYSLSYLFENNNNLDIHELYSTFSTQNLTSLSLKDFIHNSFILITKVFEKYDNELVLFIIIDALEKIEESSIGKETIEILQSEIETLHFASHGMINKSYQTQVKIISIANTDSFNSNKVLYKYIAKLKEIYKPNEQFLFDYGVIFLIPKEIFKPLDMERYIQQTSIIEISDHEKRAIISQVENNYSNIDFLFKNKIELDESIINICLREYYESKFQSLISSLSNEELLVLTYNIFSYHNTLKDIAQPLSQSFFNNGYQQFDYRFIIPYIYKDNKTGNIEINFKTKNTIINTFINNFNHDIYESKINFYSLNDKFLENIFKKTNCKKLQGIILEDLMYLLLKDFKGEIVIPVNIYGKKSIKLEDFIFANIHVVSKSQKSEDDIIYKNTDIFLKPKQENYGLYFLSHRFPCIDFILYYDNQLYLIQMKKTISYDHVYQIEKDFHYLHLIMQNDKLELELERQSEMGEREKVNNNSVSKLKFWLKIAKILKNNKNIKYHFMFVYQNIAKEFNTSESFENINKKVKNEFFTKRESIRQQLFSNWTLEQKLGNLFEIERNNDRNYLIIYCNEVVGNILMCSLDDFISQLGKKNYFKNL